MKQRFIRLFFPFGSVRTVFRGPARGTRFVVEQGMGFTYALGTSSAAPRHFKQWIKPGMTVYDVGANKGQMALLFASLVGPSGRVIALEPAPVEFASCKRNIALNQLAYVQAMQVAASDSVGELQFTYDAKRPTQGKFLEVAKVYQENTAENTFTVGALPLDRLLTDQPAPDVIKIDVEGAAAAVLRGAAEILSQIGPSIYLELHTAEELAAVKDELLSRGYVVTTLDGRVVTDLTIGGQDPFWCHKPGPRIAG